MSFLGQYEHNLDSKDRLTVPAKFRAALADGVVLAKGLDPSVWVFAPGGYEEFSKQFLGETNPLGKRGRMLRRHFHGGAFDDKIDAAGRIRLPKKLIEHAGLGEGPCMIVGSDNWFEIWSAKRWADYEMEMDAEVSDVAENLSEEDEEAEMATATHRVVGTLAESANLSYVPQEHEPVLATELVDVLDPKPGETFVDCTFGGGGHASLISERIGSEGELIAVDRDPSAEERWSEFAAHSPSRSRFLRADFVAALEGLRGEGTRPDGIVFDLGMSSMQIDAWERGFSYSYDAPLDMRMDPTQSLSAATVVNDWPQDRLANVIRELGEERRAGSIAREITKRRPIDTTAQLVSAIKAAIPPSERFGRGHPAKRTFQAIRIAVNGELDALDHALPLAWAILPTGGRLGAISFHSLEDRRVKRFMADRARGCICPPELPVCVCGREPEADLLTKRAIAPGPEELESNPRASSAHLRAALKIREAEDAG